jgi:hypothetical protein
MLLIEEVWGLRPAVCGSAVRPLPVPRSQVERFTRSSLGASKQVRQTPDDAILLYKRFIRCVNLAVVGREPEVYLFPAALVAKGLRYFKSGFLAVRAITQSLDLKPQGKTKDASTPTINNMHLDAAAYLENYAPSACRAVHRSSSSPAGIVARRFLPCLSRCT